MPVGIYNRKPHTKKHNKNISKSLKGNTNRKGWRWSKEQRLAHSIIMMGKSLGIKSGQWKGGKHKNNRGYIMVLATRYGVRKYWLEHRLRMEDHLGRKLEPYEAVHHINGRKDDNRISNLQLMVGFFHSAEIRCPHCLKKFLVQ
jgi:hypothetical protein